MGKAAVIKLIKTDPVLSAAAILAAVSCFFVKPDVAYLAYIDYRTLALLLCLMAVMKGFGETGLFSVGANALLKRTKTLRQGAAVLVLLCFFSSMLITNDVALITFVPFAIEVLERAGSKSSLPLVVVLQTVAANLGSMLTPIGNPQNLYLYSQSGMSTGQMLRLTIPYWLFSLALVLLCLPLFKSTPTAASQNEALSIKTIPAVLYGALFLLCMLCVARIIPYGILLGITVAFFLVYNRRLLLKIDYSLLLTFTAFFVFIGNMGRLPAVSGWLNGLIKGREVLVAVVSSQVISNVPAALLLSGFTKSTDLLIIGTNIGGLGTLIASMASLISYKYIAACDRDLCAKYFGLFSALNLVFLVLMCLMHMLIR